MPLQQGLDAKHVRALLLNLLTLATLLVVSTALLNLHQVHAFFVIALFLLKQYLKTKKLQKVFKKDGH